MHCRNRLLALGFVAATVGIGVVATVSIAGCRHADVVAASQVGPATIERDDGTGVTRLVLTEDAVRNLGIRTEPVREIPAPGNAAARETVIPISAVLYDHDGTTWTYTNPEPRTYVRTRVVLGAIDNGVWVLRSGPPPGTAVVTVGGAELLGTQDGVDGTGQ